MKLFFLSLALSFTAVSFTQELKTHQITTDIQDVTVFLTGGEVHRTGKVNLKKGRNKLVFTKISTVADNKSIQFSSESELNLVSVSSEIDYISINEDNPRVKEIRDTIQLLKDQVVTLQNERSAYQIERQLLETNKLIKGEQQNLTVEELSAMAAYYRKHMMEINKATTEYDVQTREKNALKYRYENQLAELNYKESVKCNQIIVIVDSEFAKTVNVDLKYIVSNCGWQANYDLLAKNLKDNITLKYKAKVYNNTGNDWSNVNQFLSTSDPNLSASAPTLSPWYLNYSSLRNQTRDDYEGNEYVVPQNRGFKQYYQNVSTPEVTQNLDGLTFQGNVNQNRQSNNPEENITFTNIEVSQLSTTFDIERK